MRKTFCILMLLGLTAGCGDDEELTNAEKVSLIYDNIQPTIDKIIAQGLLAKDASTSGANITPFTVNGDNAGTMTVGGQIAQSSGGNQNFTLWVQLDGPYSDTGTVKYATDNTSDSTKLQFGLHIANQPSDNAMEGTLNGPLTVSGDDVEGTATFALAFATDLADDDAAPTVICSRVTGSVTQDGETKSIDFVLPKDMTGLDQSQIDKCNALAP